MMVAGDAQTLGAATNHAPLNVANALGAWLGQVGRLSLERPAAGGDAQGRGARGMTNEGHGLGVYSSASRS